MKTILSNTAALIIVVLVVSYLIFGGDLFRAWALFFDVIFGWIF